NSARSKCGPASTRSLRPSQRPSSSGSSRTGTRSTPASPWSGSSQIPRRSRKAPRETGTPGAAAERYREDQGSGPEQEMEPLMRLAEGSPGARILAFGGYQPANVVTNADLAAKVETSDEWIRSRVGIASRRIAAPDETVADMAVAAGGKALAGSGLS